MKYIILGGGALGSILGTHLIQAGEDVTILARGVRAAHLREHGISVTGLVDISVPCQVETDPGCIHETDVLIVAVKTYHTVDAISPLKHIQAGSVFSVQNGVLKNQQLIDVFGEDAVLGSIGILSGELLDDDQVRFTLNQIVELGELPKGTSTRTEAIVADLNNAGINASETASIQSVEWSKFVGWSGYASLSVITRLETHRFLSDVDSALITARVMRETASVAAALGVAIEDRAPFPSGQVSQGTEDEAVAVLNQAGETLRGNAPQHRMSTLQDVERGQRLEIEETLGHTLQEGKRLGVPVSTVETCYRLLSSIDRSLAG
jgi:2-dehydropantoate 2-reductase